jgi:hypothetical protein
VQLHAKNTMDGSNIPKKNSQIDPKSPDRLPNTADVYSTLKDSIKKEAQQLLTYQDPTSSQTFTQACSAMKVTIADEAHRIIYAKPDAITDSLEQQDTEIEQPDCQEIQQPKAAQTLK